MSVLYDETPQISISAKIFADVHSVAVLLPDMHYEGAVLLLGLVEDLKPGSSAIHSAERCSSAKYWSPGLPLG